MARTIESELHSEEHTTTASSEGGSIRLRRCSSVEAPNIALLLQDTSAPVAVEQPTTRPRAPKLQRQSSIEEMEKESCKLEPRIEGRIVLINEETRPQLISEREAWEKSVTRTIRELGESTESN